MNATARLTLVSPNLPSPVAPAVVRPGALRLTRRGRLVLLAAFVLAILAGGVLFGSGTSRASGERAEARAHEYVVVQPGQTLWGIALATAPGEDPRATIERIRELNALTTTGVQAGQRIALP